MMVRHAGLIALWDAGVWRGALIEGVSGAGKSDLMLRALQAGWTLVADDRVEIAKLCQRAEIDFGKSGALRFNCH